MIKVPEGATHAAADGRFYKLEGEWFYSNHMGHWRRHWSGEPEGAYVLPSKPEASGWKGPEDGLPPVGLEVEFFENGQWVPVRVMYVSEHTVLLKHLHDETGDPEGAYTPHDAEFRPVRTAEQLAAKVRSKACDDIYGVLCTAAREGNRSDMAEALYDAGYRKVQP